MALPAGGTAQQNAAYNSVIAGGGTEAAAQQAFTENSLTPVASTPGNPNVTGGSGSGVVGAPSSVQTQAFGTAKDQTGLAVQGALKSLQAVMAQRGLTGSGMEAAGTTQLMQGGAEDLSQAATTEAQTLEGQQFQGAEQTQSLGNTTALANAANTTNVNEFNQNLTEEQQQLALQQQQDAATQTAQKLAALTSAYSSSLY